MSEVTSIYEKAKIVMMGNEIYAGISDDDIDAVKLGMVIRFKDEDSYRKALRQGTINIDMALSFD